MKIAAIILSILLLFTGISNFHIDIAYYQLLRWLVTVGAVLISINYYKSKQQAPFIIFCIIAVLFNPIAPLYFGKSLWKIIDIIAGVIFILPLLNFNKTVK